MPRYFLHIRSDGRLIEDLEGVDLNGEKEALDEATDAAREILAERVRKGEFIEDEHFEVHDQNGTKLFSLPFRDVLRLR